MTLTEGPATAAPPPVVQVFQMCLGTLVAPMLRVIVERGIAAGLTAGPRSSADLARETGMHEPSLHRLLRSATGLGLFATEPDGRFSLGPLGHAAVELGPQPSWMDAAFHELEATLATGTTGMQIAHGVTVFEYLQAHPEDRAWFDRGMALINAGEPQAVAEAYDFSDARCVADIGGGNGTMLGVLLDRYAGLEGVLFDTPDTLANVIPDLPDRCRIVPGDFFEAVPAGADAYLLSHVVHDWEETLCLEILRNVRAAIAPDGRLLIVEMVMPPGDEPHPARMLDMVMLLLTGGMERTEQEYTELLGRAGFRLDRVIPTRSPVSVLEARPV
jgi:O-methyltransferase